MLSDEVETAQTVHMMDELAEADAAHRLVIEATYRALDQAGLNLESSDYAKAVAVFWFLKRTIRYVPTPGTSPLVDQTLIPPATLLAMPDPEGDCPQFSMLASAMMKVLCVPCLYKTIAADEAFPDTYSHIYNIVRIAPGRFMPFDSSNGPEPGAEYSRAFKRRVWPQVHKTKCGRRLGDANGDTVNSTLASAVESIPTTITPGMLGMIGLSIGALWFYSQSGKKGRR